MSQEIPATCGNEESLLTEDESQNRVIHGTARAPSTESIVAWFSSSLLYKEKLLLVEPGRLYYWGIPRAIDQRLQEMLKPVFSHINREDHCERFCLLHHLRAIIRRCGFNGLGDCSGCVKLYVSHFPCISCVSIICQFIRFLPAVRFELEFDNLWQTRFPKGRRSAKVHAQKVFDVMEGEVDVADSSTS
eukprot:TRINITY_DN86486_c0_g1_i1.p1 TRINITY_DN86486_c0_g1~~TRINITY_DN86486_c0_g1_i1.p1  ORF type:complete len:189 (+),score=11.03 TRINITY_DN86486_c0_g1_i1:57-623(+)